MTGCSANKCIIEHSTTSDCSMSRAKTFEMMEEAGRMSSAVLIGFEKTAIPKPRHDGRGSVLSSLSAPQAGENPQPLACGRRTAPTHYVEAGRELVRQGDFSVTSFCFLRRTTIT